MIEVTFEGGVYGLHNSENEYYWIGLKSAPGTSFPRPHMSIPLASYSVLYKAAIEQGFEESDLRRKKKAKKVRSASTRSVKTNPNTISIF